MPPDIEPALRIGSLFQGGYEITGELGAGSFGWVYKARQLSTGQDVAIKLLRVRVGDNARETANQADRFRREMRLCAGLSHPNIVRLIDSGETADGRLYAVFEHVPGVTLKEVLATEGKLAPREAVHLMGQVLDALACAHARGVVHRDLKPENVMVTRTGVRRNALVLDFGLGGLTGEAERWELPRITATYEMMGTPCYAAPEQLRGEPPSTRSDLYSWGLILLECLTGDLAVQGGSLQEVVLKQLGPEPITIPAWLRGHRLGRLLEIVTQKAVEKRDVTIAGLLEVLADVELPAALPGRSVVHEEQRAEGERRQLTVVSCRLSVAARDGRALDLEELDEILHAQHALYAEVAARSGGSLAYVLADRVLLVFGYPRAQEDDARRAARVAARLAAEAARATSRLERERGVRLEVRIGVHTGLVLVRRLRQGDDASLELVGLTPQIATRLEELARPGEVLVSGDTYRLLRGELSAEPAGELAGPAGGPSLPVFRLLPEDRRASAESPSWVRETPLVGRREPLRQLLTLWERAERGRPGAALVTGEPGIGKSRLVRELRRRVPPEARLEARCTAELGSSPLRPVVELLTGMGPIEGTLTRWGMDLDTTLPLLAALLAPPGASADAALPYTPERQKELTLAAILALFLRMARDQPLVLVLEDLHWADPTTLELATLLVQEVGAANLTEGEAAPRLLVVLTARPEFVPPWPLDAAALLQLPRLARAEVEAMVAAGLATGRPLPPAVLERIVRRADGIPLFVEEVTRVILDAGGEGQGGGNDEAEAVEIPTTLRDLLTARLDGLSTSARATVQLAAVLGREFRYEVLRAVARTDESLLREDVRELQDAGLVFPRRTARAETFVFKHSLVRDAAYESITRLRRQGLHGRVASTLAQRFPDVEQTQPELLARHFERAGQPEIAVDHWHRSGDRARRRAAYAEAVEQLQHAMTLLESLPSSPDRSRREIEVLTTLGTALLSTRGYAAEEVAQTFARAQQLAVEVGDAVSLKVVAGLAGVPLTRGDREAAEALVPRLERLARRTDKVEAITGHALLGAYRFWLGEFASAREHAAVGIRLYGTEEFQAFAREYGYDGGLFCHAYAMTSLWNLGCPDQAEALRLELTAIAEENRNPYSMGVALGFGTTLSHDRGEPAVTLDQAMRLVELANEQKLYLWLAAALCAQGGAALQQGDAEAAIPTVQQGLALLQGMGIRTSYSYYLSYLADAYLHAGRTDEGLATVDEGLGLCQALIARFHEADLCRLRGDLLALRGDRQGAEAAFGRALALARERQARGFELRAATSLARLRRAAGQTAEARAVLQPVYEAFGEGFDTGDLRTARALLAELD